MDLKLKPLLLASLISGGYMLASPQSFAAPAPRGEAAASKGYVYNNGGRPVLDSSGNCVRTSSWTPEMANEQCDPRLAQRAATPVAAQREATPPQPAEAAPASPPVSESTEVAAIEPQRQPFNISEKAFFDFDRAELKEEDRRRLDEALAQLGNMPEDAIVRIIGHTDSIGTEQYNRELSMRRARAAQEYLVSHGIGQQRIVISGMGESNPVADNSTDEGRAQNRRADIEIQAEAPSESAPAGAPGNQPSLDQGRSEDQDMSSRSEEVVPDGTALSEETPNPDEMSRGEATEEETSGLSEPEDADEVSSLDEPGVEDDRSRYSEARPNDDVSSMKRSPNWPRPVGWDR